MVLQPEGNLTEPELVQAATVAVQRVVECVFRGRENQHGEKGWGWDRHIEGAAAEMIFAKRMNKYWNGTIGDVQAADVGSAYEVRSTDCNGGHLLLHRKDPDHRIFVLAIGLVPNFRFRGWIFAVVGKQDKYWEERIPGRPCYWVPQGILHPMSQLPKLSEAEKLYAEHKKKLEDDQWLSGH